ncbi:hypothetical protein JCM3774_001273 [Rhodotorula dairenensis]
MPSTLAAPTSRIPRTRSRTRSTEHVDENAPPAGRPAPSRAGKAAITTTAAGPAPTTAASTRQHLRVAFAPLQAGNAAQQEQMPTPPASQSPPRKTARAGAKAETTQKTSKLPRARPATGIASKSSLAVPTSSGSTTSAAGGSTTTRRRASRSPAVAIPPGPSHAPHVLAARRRASVSPLPAAASASSASDLAGAVPAKPKSRKSRSSGTSARPRPRPSELLPAPLGSPPPVGGNGDDGNEGDFDELLLLPPEMTRGRGEGKTRPHHGQLHHSSQQYQAMATGSSSNRRSTSRQPEPAGRLPSSQASSTGSSQSIKSEHSFELDAPPPVASSPKKQGLGPADVSFSVTAPSSDGAFGGEGGDPYEPNHTDPDVADNASAATPATDGMDSGEGNDMGGFDGHDFFQFDDDAEAVAAASATPHDAAATDFVMQEEEGKKTSLDISVPVAETDHSAAEPAAAPSPRAEADVVVVAVAEDAVEEAEDRPTTAAPTDMEGGPQFADLEEASSGSEMGDNDCDLEAHGHEFEAHEHRHALEEEEELQVEIDSAEAQEVKPDQDAVSSVMDGRDASALPIDDERHSVCLHHDGVDNDADVAAEEEEQEEEAAAVGDESTFEFPPHSARQSRPSYPPLSPNQTGEFDEVVPVRMASTSPEPAQVQVDVEVELKVAVAVQEAEEPRSGGAIPVEADAPDVFAAQSPARPAVASTSPAAFPLHGTPTVLPAFLRPSTFFPATRSPSPAVALFPSPRPLASPASRPTLQFASPRLPHERYPSPGGQSLHFAPESSPAKSWTRGPAFFRSSSFSPPPHAALPKTATLFERHPGGAQARLTARGEGGAAEQSREYQQWAGLDTSSPAPTEGGDVSRNGSRHDGANGTAAGDVGEPFDREEDDEEEDEVILVGHEAEALERAKSRSLSPASTVPVGVAGPQAHEPEQSSASSRSSSEDDGGYRSPARSVTGDVCMASPSPRPSVSSLRSNVEPDSPTTPREGDDCRMASPSPARSEHGRATAQQQGSPLRARIGEFVEGSRSRIQGMLFGSPSKQPASSNAAAPDVASRGVGANNDADDPEQPFTNPNVHSRGPASVADTTLSASHQSQSYSTASFSSTASRRSRRRSRPSHPTLPVIEISSTDAHAAARAAAILKVYHKYVEQGVEAVDLERLVAAEQAGAAFDASVAAEGVAEADEEEEEELRTLLHDAEEEVRELVPRQGSVGSTEPILSGLHALPASRQSDSTATSTSVGATPAPWTSREWRRLEQALVEVGRRRQRAASAVSGASTSMSMTSEAIASASVTGEDVEPDAVIETFLRKWSIPKIALHDQWSWDKLLVRVEALQARRAKDARRKRATSVRSQDADPDPSHRGPVQTVSLNNAPDAASGHSAGEEEGHSRVKLEALHEQDKAALAGGEAYDTNELSSEEDEDDGRGAEADETFFAPERRYRRRRSSIEPVHQPTALANPALRHLYDATPAPEKPHLPLRGILRPLPSAPESDEEGEDVESGSGSGVEVGDRSHYTPEPRDIDPESGKSPSSAQRLLSYLGSFVRRSPGASPSSTRVAPRSSGSSSPEENPERPEMKQVSQQSAAASLVSPRSERTSKPLPPISDRKILPLPPSHAPVASTSAPAAAAVDASDDQSFAAAGANNSTASSSSFVPLAFRRRRRSSHSGPGERSLVWDVVNAIEEAESSREEEEARIVDLLQNTSGTGGIKRRAASGDLRIATAQDQATGQSKDKGKAVDWRGFVEIDRELERVFVPTGTRALDRRVSGEKRATRR